MSESITSSLRFYSSLFVPMMAQLVPRVLLFAEQKVLEPISIRFA